MKVFVKDEKCIGCGSCVAITDSKIFDFNEEGKAYAVVKEVKKEDESTAQEAIKYCPTNAISEGSMEDEEKADTSNSPVDNETKN